MREIKFRAWDKEEKKMVDLKDDKYNIRTTWEGKLYLVNTEITDDDGYDYQMEVEFLEYTGLEDKKGKEIYKGDVIKAINRKYDCEEDIKKYLERFPVTYLKGCFMFGNWNAHEFFNKFTFIEVTGNIYEP